MITSKRLLAAGLVAALGFTAAACGDDDDDESTSDDTTADGTTAPEETTAATTGATTAPEGTTAETTAPEGTSAPVEEGQTVGLLFDITGRGDKSFNDAAAAGLDQAVEEFGVVPSESTPTGDGDRA